MGQSLSQSDFVFEFVPLLRAWLADCGAQAYVAGDVYVAWVPEHPLVRVSPDAAVFDAVPDPQPASFQLWLPGHKAPRFALEYVSDDWKKDYDEAPQKYAQLGCRELVIFDAEPGDRAGRHALQVFRRTGDGAFVRQHAGPGPVWSVELGAWLVVRGGHLRLSRDQAGHELVPTVAERAELERSEKLRERADKEHERAEKERERAEKERERAEKERERAEKEHALAYAEQERAEKESALAELARLRALMGGAA